MRNIRLSKFNQTQIKTIANLLIEFGKWLVISVVLSTLFSQQIKNISSRENVVVALILGFLLIMYAVWILREVKDK